MRRLRRIDIKRGEKIVAEVKALAKRLSGRNKVEKIILFGSFARGDFSEASDIDLLVIGDFRERFLERGIGFEEATSLPVETFCYTREEFERMRKAGNPFILAASKTGEVIYSNPRK
ncbi:nucleotidyltransferase domain-containing protein [Candidatus Micrarchaeota archaeon]|nr:nucleotidyltransferase domain-containing protein [Candidatus Micrarchaeota archaeon]